MSDTTTVTAELVCAVDGAVDSFDRLIQAIKASSPFVGSNVYPVTDRQLEIMSLAYHRMAEIARLA